MIIEMTLTILGVLIAATGIGAYRMKELNPPKFDRIVNRLKRMLGKGHKGDKPVVV
jgi:hypothetical protein